ncbi:MAG: penicillin-binding transpeptidase domain-containing protein [Lachnospiraceae bacterium]|jgi:cell division protein FtsI/penicillin-binding protein 2|nr:penicillin-binding transpeptidase domain-containing protein [Lachnospiraceae bacterium]
MRGKILGIALLFCAGLLAGCGKEMEQPEELLQNYIAFLDQGDYDSMYEFLTMEARESVDPEHFAERYENIYGGIEASDLKLEIRSQEEENKKAETRRVPYTLSMETVAGTLTFDSVAVFQKEEEGYRMSWDTQDILPDLQEGERVKVVTTSAARGNIYDRNHVALAREGTASSVGIVPGRLPADSRETLEQLAEILDLDVARIEKALSAGWVREDTFVPVRTVSKEANELKEQAVALPGVMVSDVSLRIYPYGEKAAMVTGYVQNVTAEDLENHPGEGYHAGSIIGKSGVERAFEEQLRSRDGYAIQILTKDGQVKKTLLEKAPQEGVDVVLTIDITLQQHLYQQLSQDEGCAVAMNPDTGAVLALVSAPAYDPNDFVMGFTSHAWEEINADERQPLYNRFRASYVPGSAFKPVTAALALTEGTLDPVEDVQNQGLSWQKDNSWGAYEVTTLEDYSPKTLENALVYSDNIYFAKAACNLGTERFEAGLARLGFGEKMDFDLDMSVSSFGTEGKIDSETELADSGYGQGKLLVNPLHLASMYTALVHEGQMMHPYLTEETGPHFWGEQAFSPEAAREVLEDLYQVIENPQGTGHEALSDQYTWAGKTGTAEIKDSKEDETGTELGWFVGMQLEGDKEPLLAVMMVEDVKDRGGSHYVIPKIKACFDAYYGQAEGGTE